jgi:dsRNA-specific ribonuclease
LAIHFFFKELPQPQIQPEQQQQHNPKSKTYTQKIYEIKNLNPKFILDCQGPEHSRLYLMKLVICFNQKTFSFEGKAKSIKMAKQMASKEAILFYYDNNMNV